MRLENKSHFITVWHILAYPHSGQHTSISVVIKVIIWNGILYQSSTRLVEQGENALNSSGHYRPVWPVELIIISIVIDETK